MYDRQLTRFLLTSLFVIFITPQAFAAAGSKVVVVDFERALAQTKAGQDALKKLETEFNGKKKELEKRGMEFMKWQEQASKNADMKTPAALAALRKEALQRADELQKLEQQMQAALLKRREALFGPILEKLQKMVRTIVDTENVDIVIHAGAIAWVRPSLDITDQLVRTFENAK